MYTYIHTHTPLHYITLHYTVHYITLHDMTFHYITYIHTCITYMHTLHTYIHARKHDRSKRANKMMDPKRMWASVSASTCQHVEVEAGQDGTQPTAADQITMCDPPPPEHARQDL